MTKEQRGNLYSARWAVRELLEADPKNEKLKFAEAELSEALGESATGEKEEVSTPPVSAPTDKSTGTLVVVVGHTKADGGATFALGGNEYKYNSAVAAEMKLYAKAKYPNFRVEVVFRDGVGISGAYAKAKTFKPDACIELHFNAANKKAVGTETLSTNESMDKMFSGVIQSAMCRVFERTGQSRGVKILKKGDRGAGNIYSLPGVANCLVEPFFGDTPSDAKLGQEKQSAYARALVDATVSFVSKS